MIGRYVNATGDLKLAAELWPNVERALDWIGKSGDRDGDGYIEYECQTPTGLANQGWKDSLDSVSHADGRLAKAPIALAEVQGYAYAAYCSLAEVAGRLNKHDLRDHLREEARALKTNFERDFWLKKENMLALALDGDKRPCAVMASNGAHCLAAGLLDGEHAASLCERLLAEDMFSGWGVRTLSSRERRYNPMSYHNGSVWPHDNAMAAWGLATAGPYRPRRGENWHDRTVRRSWRSQQRKLAGTLLRIFARTQPRSGAVSGRVSSPGVVRCECILAAAGDPGN